MRKARAYLCELKSRRSPKRSLFVRKAEGMESPIVHNAEGIAGIALSDKNDAGIAGVYIALSDKNDAGIAGV